MASTNTLAFVGEDIAAPSVLWMRRMLEYLSPHVSLLCVERDPGSLWRNRYQVVMLANDRPSLMRRARAKLVGSGRTAGGRRAEVKLSMALERSASGSVLVHYVNLALKYSAVWKQFRGPVFVHCHGFDVTWDMREHKGSGKRLHPDDYVERVLALPEHVKFIANSEETKSRLQSVGIVETRIAVNYLGVPIGELPDRADDRDEVTILYLGRLVDCKGPDLVIRAFEAACSRGLRGRLTIAGDGPLRVTCELLRARSPFADRVEMLGAVDAEAGAQLRARADIFTSHNCLGPVTRQVEAFGVSVLEAMAAGLPVVVGRSGGVPEIVRDQTDGFLIEPGDIDAHAEAFLTLARDPVLRRRMGSDGWRRASMSFSQAREIEGLRAILGLPPSSNCDKAA